MKIEFYNTMWYQIEVLPRIMIFDFNLVAFEWLFWGFYIGKKLPWDEDCNKNGLLPQLTTYRDNRAEVCLGISEKDLEHMLNDIANYNIKPK